MTGDKPIGPGAPWKRNLDKALEKTPWRTQSIETFGKEISSGQVSGNGPVEPTEIGGDYDNFHHAPAPGKRLVQRKRRISRGYEGPLRW